MVDSLFFELWRVVHVAFYSLLSIMQSTQLSFNSKFVYKTFREQNWFGGNVKNVT